ncbi:MAG: hypothetical protein DCC75_02925 [Proteobacteria bacterium]|nr:MAG: hypothetical protein DCC75_02925 [Pseudomonadota bacterium]
MTSIFRYSTGFLFNSLAAALMLISLSPKNVRADVFLGCRDDVRFNGALELVCEIVCSYLEGDQVTVETFRRSLWYCLTHTDSQVYERYKDGGPTD